MENSAERPLLSTTKDVHKRKHNPSTSRGTTKSNTKELFKGEKKESKKGRGQKTGCPNI